MTHTTRKLPCLLAIPFLLAACGGGDEAMLAGNGYVHADDDSRLVIQSLSDDRKVSLFGPDPIPMGRVDISSDGRTLCGSHYDKTIFGASLPYNFTLTKLSDTNIDEVVTSKAGQGVCFFAYDYLHLGIASLDSGDVATVPFESEDFIWVGFDYRQSIDLLAIVGTQEIGIVRDPAHQKSIKLVRLHGTVRGMTFSSLLCCARLSPNGKTLYAIMTGYNNDNSAITAIGAFATDTGRFERFYVPYLLGSTNGAEDADFFVFGFRYEDHIVSLGGRYGHNDYDLALSPDGKTLYADVFYGKNDKRIATIDTKTGMTTLLPETLYGKFALSGDGKSMIVRQPTGKLPPAAKLVKNADTPSSVNAVYSLPEGKFVRIVPGEDFITTLHPGH
jgi:hypothetical protein